jgi:hypothetical protein
VVRIGEAHHIVGVGEMKRCESRGSMRRGNSKDLKGIIV